MTASRLPRIANELDLLDEWVRLRDARLIELGCGAARFGRELLERHPQASLVGLEVDERQHALNLAAPAPRLQFVLAGAQAIPFDGGRFDGALMLKSLHHVPVGQMDAAIAEVARVLRPGGWLYASEPVFDGAYNEIIRLFNDEQRVRAEAQAALDRAEASGRWLRAARQRFLLPVRFRDFAEFEQRVMRPSFADHRIDAAMVERVRERFAPHLGPQGAEFEAPMQVRLLRKRTAEAR